jgi:hypothetical protein
MITRSQACVAIGFTLAVLFSHQVSEEGRRAAVARSFTDDVNVAGSQQIAASDRSEGLGRDDVWSDLTTRARL